MKSLIAKSKKTFVLIPLLVIAFIFIISAIDDSSSNALGEEALTFSKESGNYSSAFNLTITGPAGATIYYTTDGSEPVVGDASTKKYTGAINIKDMKGTTPNLATDANSRKFVLDGSSSAPDVNKLDRAMIIRAVAVDSEGAKTKVSTRTYFINNDIVSKYSNCAVMSIVTDPDNLLDGDTGIYVTGNKFAAAGGGDDNVDITNFAQKGREWERAAYIDYFSGSSTPMLSTGVGIRIHGGYTRRDSQKSFNIYFRDEYDYGTKGVEGYELIPDAKSKYDGSAVTDYKNIMVRNGGNDGGDTKFQDLFIQEMASERDFGVQEATPCMVYLNGEYWGLYNLQEKQSDRYVETEFNVNKDNVIVYKNFELDEGEDLDADGALLKEYNDLAKLDMTVDANYKKFQEKVDLESFIDYYATEIYINNNDWWSGCGSTNFNNVMFWRVKNPGGESAANPYGDGKWRFLLYDTEWSMALYGSREAGSTYDSIKHHAFGVPDPQYENDIGRTEANGCPHFTALFKNSDFRKQFTNTLLDIRNWDFESSRAATVLDRYASVYAPLMDIHKERWGGWGNVNNRTNDLKRFLQEREDYVFTMLENNISELTSSDRVNVSLSSNANKADNVQINTITPDIKNGWSGMYYKDYPVMVVADVVPGLTFDHWELTGCATSDIYSATAEVNLNSSNASIKAVYAGKGLDAETSIDSEQYYVAEFVVPFTTNKAAGNKVGMEVQINDCIKGLRSGTLNLFAQTSPYDSGEEFGTLTLSNDKSGNVIANDGLDIIKTDVAITVDGVVDSAWDKANEVALNNFQQIGTGLQGCSATAKFMWDAGHVYVLVKVKDNELAFNNNDYESDSVEIFFDEDAANPAEYDTDMFQYRIVHNGTTAGGKGNPGNYNVQSGIKIYDGETNGYYAEYKIPFRNSKVSGDQVAFELSIMDCISDYELRIGKLNLYSTASPFNNRAEFGAIDLVDVYPANGMAADAKSFYAVKTNEVINIDGEKEAGWDKAVPIVLDKYSIKNQTDVSYPRAINATARVLWDANNLYVLVRSVDNELVMRESINDTDGIELYFDEDTYTDDNAIDEAGNVQYETTAFQHRIRYDASVTEGKNYTEYLAANGEQYAVTVATSLTEKPIPTNPPQQTPAPTPAPTNDPEKVGYKATFEVDSHASIITYMTQDYSDESGKAYNQTQAVSRDSDTGEPIEIDGQVNFTIVPDSGYYVDSVTVTPEDNYKNLKEPSETGFENTYRITKMTGPVTVTVVTKSGTASTPKPTNAPDAENGMAYTVTFETDSHASITTYKTQDYTDLAGKMTNQTQAVSRDSDTGEPTADDGQVNFTVVVDEGYVIDTISVTPDGDFKNLKEPEETGLENTYRITKIEGPLVVSVKTRSVNAAATQYKATFSGEHFKITTYDTQDYTNTAGKHTNQTSAIARDSDTGAIDTTGQGQVNFTIVPDSGYTVESVTVTPDSNFKNLKGEEDTLLANTYRITKITGNVTVTIKMKGGSSVEPTVKPAPTQTPVPTQTPPGDDGDGTGTGDDSEEGGGTGTGDGSENGDGTGDNGNGTGNNGTGDGSDNGGTTATTAPGTQKPSQTQSPSKVTPAPSAPTQAPGVGKDENVQYAPGAEVEVGDYLYLMNQNNTVTLKKCYNKNVKTFSVPAKIKLNGTYYKVTAIAKNAFKNCKKLKKITLSKNTVLIQKNAFYGCKSLKKVIVKSKVVKSVGKKAFAKTHKKLVIKVPKSKFKVYSTKTFKKKGQVATAKIKK